VNNMIRDIPLFPLGSVILPGGRIPMQLFEPRYLDMLTRCMKQQSGFVVVLLSRGNETGGPAQFHDVGTCVDIVDFQQLDNGLLGITVEGDCKVRVLRNWQQADGLHVGDVERLPPEPGAPVPGHLRELPSVLKALSRHPVIKDLGMTLDFEDARAVGWRLTELLPWRFIRSSTCWSYRIRWNGWKTCRHCWKPWMAPEPMAVAPVSGRAVRSQIRLPVFSEINRNKNQPHSQCQP